MFSYGQTEVMYKNSPYYFGWLEYKYRLSMYKYILIYKWISK